MDHIISNYFYINQNRNNKFYSEHYTFLCYLLNSMDFRRITILVENLKFYWILLIINYLLESH